MEHLEPYVKSLKRKAYTQKTFKWEGRKAGEMFCVGNQRGSICNAQVKSWGAAERNTEF